MTINLALVKKLLWRTLAAGFLIYLGSYLAIVAYIQFGGEDVKNFCAQELHGKAPAEVEALARRTGLVSRPQSGFIRVTQHERATGHACDVAIAEGRVTKLTARFRF